MQHWESRRAQFARVRVKHNGTQRGYKGLGQRAEDQNVAGRDGVSDGHILREHPDGKRAKLRNNRPVLLPDEGVHERDVGSLPLRRVVQKHQGDVRRPKPPDTLCVQRHGGVHEYYDVGSGTVAVRGGVGRRSVLLERLRRSGDADDPSHRLFARGNASVSY